jgi:DNA transformation protein
MARSNQYLEYILEQLQRMSRLSWRRMFGGAGLYSDDVFFGLIYKDRLYFKTDDNTRPEYEARGSEPFRPRPTVKVGKMAYYTVPADVLEDPDELVTWAHRSAAAAVAAKAARVVKTAENARAKNPRAKKGHESAAASRSRGAAKGRKSVRGARKRPG